MSASAESKLDGSIPSSRLTAPRLLLLVLSIGLSGLLLELSMPPCSISYFGWICVAPVLAASQGLGFALPFAAGIASSLCAATLAARGLGCPSHLGESGPGWIYLGYALFGLVIALVCGVCGSVSTTPSRSFQLASFAVFLEACLLVVLPAHLVLSQYREPGVLAVTSLLGVWAASFAIWWVNLAIENWVASRRLIPVLATLGSLAILLGLGHISRQTPVDKLRVAVLQTGSGDLEILQSLTHKAGKLGAALVVWPELSAIGIAPGGNTDRLRQTAKIPATPPFVTTFVDDASPLPHNVAALFSKNGESARYSKRKPFAGENSMHAAGTQPIAVPFLEGLLGLNICFDSCYPSIMRDTRALDPLLIALPSLDPDTPHGVIQAIHAAYTTFRAAELGIPILRSETTAYSMIVDGNGSILASESPGNDRVLIGDIHLRWSKPPATIVGDWFLFVCFIGLTLPLILSWRAKFQR